MEMSLLKYKEIFFILCIGEMKGNKKLGKKNEKKRKQLNFLLKINKKIAKKSLIFFLTVDFKVFKEKTFKTFFLSSLKG